MANTTGGLLKAYIETLGLGVPVYNDYIPQPANATDYPAIVIQGGISAVPDADGGNDPNGTEQEQVQIDLWEWSRRAGSGVPTGSPARTVENPALVSNLKRALRSVTLTSVGTPARRVYSTRLRNSRRIMDPDQNLIHHALTVAVYRAI